MIKILVINPGSTSTKLSVFENEQRILDETINHDKKEIDSFLKVADQLDYRYGIICRWLKEKGIKVEELDVIAARGGMLRPIEGGIYKVSDQMIEDLLSAKYGEHASNLGAPLARKIAGENSHITCIMADPPCVDELNAYARLSGHPLLNHASIFHALNQKTVARKIASSLGKKYEECNLIVAHLGGGISVGVHKYGKVIHVNNGLDGNGPFSPERAGTIPRNQLIELCFSGQYAKDELRKMLNHNGGLMAYLGSNDVRDIEKRANEGDKENRFYLEAMCYHIAREIGAGGAVLRGNCDAIILTGGIAYSKMVTDYIKSMVSFIAPVKIYPGSDENFALAEAAIRVMCGEEKIKNYE